MAADPVENRLQLGGTSIVRNAIKAGEFKFAAGAEFVEFPSTLPAFQEAYGFELESDQLLILSGGNTAATLRAAALNNSDVNGAMTYGTDGGLDALLTMLANSLKPIPATA
ncbi:MAG: glycine betaine ABC transporter substrate-binding protein [Marinobacter sp.]|uniref:hypothetical protein n=1 Tax=Marinobacter sp. TaxID=50741 RepID=UPI00396E2325